MPTLETVTFCIAQLVCGVAMHVDLATSEVQGWYFYKCQFYFPPCGGLTWFSRSGTNLQKSKLDIHK